MIIGFIIKNEVLIINKKILSNRDNTFSPTLTYNDLPLDLNDAQIQFFTLFKINKAFYNKVYKPVGTRSIDFKRIQNFFIVSSNYSYTLSREDWLKTKISRKYLRIYENLFSGNLIKSRIQFKKLNGDIHKRRKFLSNFSTSLYHMEKIDELVNKFSSSILKNSLYELLITPLYNKSNRIYYLNSKLLSDIINTLKGSEEKKISQVRKIINLFKEKKSFDQTISLLRIQNYNYKFKRRIMGLSQNTRKDFRRVIFETSFVNTLASLDQYHSPIW